MSVTDTTRPRAAGRPQRSRLGSVAMKFAIIGAFGVLVDSGAYAFFQYGWFGPTHGPLYGHEKLASIAATAVATVYSWVCNRFWAFRGSRTAEPVKEIALFAVFNVIGALITAACVAFAIDVLHLRGLSWESTARIIGIVLGTVFRFWAYRTFVFTASPAADVANEESEVDRTRSRLP